MEWREGPSIKNTLVMIIAILAVAAAAAGGVTTSKTYSWETQHARPGPTGDLEWTPEPFVFEAGDSVRYIDFEKGSDSNSGTSKDSAWKHHPWDSHATAVAASCAGVHTYVFKRGAYYFVGSWAGCYLRFRSDHRWMEKGCGSQEYSG
jgi:hypothetical protein